MTTAQVLSNAPTLEILDHSIPMRNLQIALLNQQYAPTDPLFAKNPIVAFQAPDLRVQGGSEGDFGSDKVTLGDATSVLFLARYGL